MLEPAKKIPQNGQNVYSVLIQKQQIICITQSR